MSDYGFLRSGLVGPTSGSLGDEAQLQMMRTIVAVTKVLMQQAIATADKYVRATGRRCITGKDTRLALMYEANEFFERDDWEAQFFENLEEEKEHTYLTDDESEESGEDDGENDGENDCEDGDGDVQTDDICESFDDTLVAIDPELVELHAKVTRYALGWSSWHPTDPVKAMLKRAIDNIEV